MQGQFRELPSEQKAEDQPGEIAVPACLPLVTLAVSRVNDAECDSVS